MNLDPSDHFSQGVKAPKFPPLLFCTHPQFEQHVQYALTRLRTLGMFCSMSEICEDGFNRIAGSQTQSVLCRKVIKAHKHFVDLTQDTESPSDTLLHTSE